MEVFYLPVSTESYRCLLDSVEVFQIGRGKMVLIDEGDDRLVSQATSLFRSMSGLGQMVDQLSLDTAS